MFDTPAGGFSLVEVLVAMALVAGAVATLASLGVLGLLQSDASHDAGQALMLAQAKLDELRAATWRFDGSGAPVNDPMLATTSLLTLTAGGAGTPELLDRFGRPASSSAVLQRRWSITPYDSADPDTLLLQACVEPIRDTTPGRSRQCLVTIRTRQP